MPKWPTVLDTGGKQLTDAQIKIQQAYDVKMDAYNEKMKPYNRNVSIAVLVGAVSLAAISLLFEKKMKVIADGVMFGAVFSLIYGLGRGFASGDDKYSFIAVSIALVVVLALGYHRFVHPDKKAEIQAEKHLINT